MATTSIRTNFLDSSTLGAIKGLADDVAPKPVPPGLVDRFAALRDRLAAEDFAAARAVIAELRASAGDDHQVLLELGRASLIAESPRDAVQDLESAKRLNREDAEVWFLLGLAKLDLGEDAAAKEALLEAERLLPHAHEIATALAAVDSRSETAWPTGLRRLIEIHRAHPNYLPARDVLADLYLSRALNGWTEVEADGGGMLVSTATKLLRLASGTSIEPGLYATEAKHLKTAADSLQRLHALQIQDREIAGRIADLADLVKASGARHLHATWGEIGIGVILLIGFFMTVGQNVFVALLALACGGGMLVGSFEPQYRSNKVMLMRRGKTVGDAVIGLAQKNKYTAIAYNVMLMGTYPFMAAYKVYMNWGQGWLAKSDFEAFDAASPQVLATNSASQEFETSDAFNASLQPLDTRVAQNPDRLSDQRSSSISTKLAWPIASRRSLRSLSASKGRSKIKSMTRHRASRRPLLRSRAAFGDAAEYDRRHLLRAGQTVTPRIARACEDIRLSAEAVLRAERMRRERLTFGVVAHRSQTSSPVRPALAVPTQRPIEFRHEPPAEDVVRDAAKTHSAAACWSVRLTAPKSSMTRS